MREAKRLRARPGSFQIPNYPLTGDIEFVYHLSVKGHEGL